MNIKWVALIIISIVIIFIFFIDFGKKPLSFNADSIEKIEAGFSKENMRLYTDNAQISSWVDFFNSLELTSPKERHLCTYQRGPSKFIIYYTDGKEDFISYGICCLIYNGNTFVISDSSKRAKTHDELIGFGSY